MSDTRIGPHVGQTNNQHPLANTGEYSLLLAIVDQALKDLHHWKDAIRLSAEKWFASDSIEPFSYGWIEEILREDPVENVEHPEPDHQGKNCLPNPWKLGGMSEGKARHPEMGIGRNSPDHRPMSGVMQRIEEERVERRIRNGVRLRNRWETQVAQRYGLTHAEYRERVLAVKGVCEHCGRRPGDGRTVTNIATPHVYLHCLGPEMAMVCFRCKRNAGKQTMAASQQRRTA